MALTDSGVSSPAPIPTAPALAAPAFQPLARLPILHDEALVNYRTALFIARAPQAALLLMVAAAIVLAGGWGSLRAGFAWSLLLVVAIAGMVRIHVRGHARSLHRLPLNAAAADFRALLLFCGTVWGMGIFLVLPPAPPPMAAVCFALLPALALRLILKDARGTAAFALPCVAITVLAAHVQLWPGAGVISLAMAILCAALLLPRPGSWPMILPRRLKHSA